MFRATNVVGDALGRAPLVLYRGEEEVTAGRLWELLQRPNPFMRQSVFAKVVTIHQLLYGNAYVYLDEPDSLGVPRALLPLPPGMVEPVRSGNNAYSLQGWRYGGGKDSVVIPPERVVALQYAPNPSDPMVGASPLDVAQMTIESDHLASVWNQAVLRNSGSPAGLLKWAGEGRFDEADARLVKHQWENTYGGAHQAESIAVLGSNFDFQAIGVSPKDMQWMEARRWNLGDVCRAFNVPLVYLNEYESSGLSDAGLKIQAKLLYTQAVIPLAVAFGQALTERVVRPVDQALTALFDFDAVEALRDDLTEKLQHAKLLAEIGFPLNAINRKLELGFDDVEHGDTVLVNAGLVPVSDLLGSGDVAPDVDIRPTGPTEDQIAKALDIATKVGAGQMPRDSGLGLLTTLLGFSAGDAEAMLGAGPEPEAAPDAERALDKAPAAPVRAEVRVAEFIADNARRGLEYHRQGLSGDGIRPATVRAAVRMAEGYATEAKLRKMSAWFARHEGDLEASANSDPTDEDYPGPGAVAWLIWGGNPTSDPMRAKRWVDRTLAGLGEAAGVRGDHGLVMQSVVLARDAYGSEEEATEAARGYGAKVDAATATDRAWQFRVADPALFVEGSLRSVETGGGAVVVWGRLLSDYRDETGGWRLPEWRREVADQAEARRRPLEKKLQSKVSRSFNDLRRGILRGLEQGNRRGLGRTRADGDDPLTMAGIQMALGAIDPQAEPEKFRAIVEQSIGSGFEAGISKADDYGVQITEDGLNQAKARLPKLVTNFWEGRYGFWVTIYDRTRQQLAETLTESLRAGENLNQAMDRVRTVFRSGSHGLGVSRARTVARTEVLIASSLGEQETYAALGVKRVEWLSAKDAAVRRTHRIDGEVVQRGQKFSNGLRRPGDDGPPEEVINCRCDIVPVPDIEF